MEYLIPEIALILFMLVLITKFKKKIPGAEKLLKGLVVYFPPDQEKITKALANPSNFIINCGHIDEKFSYSSPYFQETEFLLLLSGFGCLSVLSSIALYYTVNFTLNTSSYIVMMMIIFCIRGSYSQTMKSGFNNPDNWMGLFFSLTLFCFSTILMYLDHYKLLNFNFHFSVTLLSLQLTLSLQRFSNIYISINHLVFCVLYSILLSLMIFPYFKYIFRTTLNYYSNSESKFQVQGLKEPSKYYKTTIFVPIGIAILWLDVFAQGAKYFVNESVWEHTRIFIVILYSFLRIYLLRTEVQILLNQSKNIIYDVIRNPTEKNKKDSDLQCKAIGGHAWPLAFQSLCYSLIILSMCLLLLCKGEIFKPYPEPVPIKNDTSKKVAYESLDDNEFLYDNSAVVTPSMSVSYYKEIKQLEDHIKSISKESTQDPVVIIEKVINSMYLPSYFYRDCIEYAIWLYHFSNFFAICLTLLYKRRFYKKLKIS